MAEIRIASAPCSWGVLSGFGAESDFPAPEDVLDGIVATGFEGTELGDPGFMPEAPDLVASMLRSRGLSMVGALVPVALADRANHNAGVRSAIKTARVLAACDGPDAWNGGAQVVLADANGKNAMRVENAGRIRPEHGLSDDEWRAFADGANLVARAVKDETGLRTAFHHHCAGFIETPEETERLLDMTDPDLVGLCYDTGHYAYAGGDALNGLRRFRERIWHVHFKDCHPSIAEEARANGWSYFDAVGNGLFFTLGGGLVDFAAVVDEVRSSGYSGWIVVEDELPPGKGNAFEANENDRELLRGLGI
ncbi:MAG: TIM barrel protein [Dehalococcoidia bacterium]